MGGGAAMRAAGKVAGIGVLNGVMRGGLSSATAAAPPASQSLRNVSRPVGVVLSSGKVSGGGELAEAQKASWEIDDWEFAGGESDFMVATESPEPMARVVFGGAPSLEEAKEATSDLKEALDKVYLSSDKSNGNENEGVVAVGQVSGLQSPSTSESSETKSCIACEPNPATVPKHAIQAFRLLKENPSAQTVVASIAADPNVWNAVMQNDALMEFLQAQKTNDMFGDQGSVRKFDESSDLGKVEDTESHVGDTGNKFEPMVVLHKIKDGIVEMVSNVGDFLQNIFGTSTAEKASAEADPKPNYFEKTMGASVLGLAVMVIMVVLLKRA